MIAETAFFIAALADGCPVDMGFLQFLEAVPEQGVLRGIALRVVVDDFLGFIACQLNQLAVSGNIRYLQVESHAALLRTFQVAGTTELQIGFGDAKTVVGITHDVDALACLLRKLEVGDEDAVTLVAASSHTASQLMQLGETEALGIQYHHHRGIRPL